MPIRAKATTTAPSITTTWRSSSIPKYAAAFTERGNTYAARGKIDRALQDFEQAIKFNPSYAGVFNSRALLYQRKGDNKPRAGRPRPGDQTRSRIRGRAQQSWLDLIRPRATLDRAIADFDRAIKANPHYELALNNRGMIYKAKGEFERALKDFDQALAINSGFAVAMLNRGETLEKVGFHDRAIKDLDRVIKLNAGGPQAYNARGTGAQPQARLRPRHRRLQPGDQTRRQIRRRL